MTKRNVVWLITKLVGVLFAYWTIVSVFVLLSSIYTYISLPSPPRFAKTDNANANAQTITPTFPGTQVNPANPTNPGVPAATKVETPVEKAKNDALKDLLWNLLLAVLYGATAWYLIKDGRFLFAVLNREEPFDEAGKPAEADSFALSKKKEEVVTSLNIAGHPTRKSEEITSLNLSDRQSEPVAADAAPASPIEILPATPAAQTESAPIAAPAMPAATAAPVVSSQAPADTQAFAPDALTNQPISSPAAPLGRPNDGGDDALIEEFNIKTPGEQK
jgi:cytoskeletal protein RodZ